MSEQKFISAANLFGWGQSFNATGKFPLIAKRVWNTYDDMIAFVSDTSDVCPAGVVLTVINDEDSKKNGAYFVASCPTLENPELPVDVQKIGSGEKLVVDTYADALALATEANIGAAVYVKTETEAGKPGLYIISAANTLERLGTTTATGDLAGDISVLQGSVEQLGKDIQAVDDKVDAIDLDPYAKSEDVNKALEKKLDSSVYTEDKKTIDEKLAAVKGAQANVLEGIVYNGTLLTVDAQSKTVTITTPEDKVRGLADGEKVLSLDTESGKLGTTLSMEYFRDEADNNTPKLRLKGVNGAQVGEAIDVSDFVKDGMLTNVELVENPEGKTGTYFRFTWNTESGMDPVVTDLDVTGLIDVYEAGNGISVTGKVISAKVKEGDQFIEVTTEGIASKGITTAITEAKNAVVGSAEDLSSAVTIYGVKKYAAELVGAHESAVTTALSAIKVTDVDSTETAGIKLTKSEEGVIGVAVSTDTLVNSLVGATGVVGPVSGTTVKLGEDIVIEEIVKDSEGNESTQQVVIGQAGSSVQSAIKTLAGKIETAIAGGITAIDGGEYITVGGSSTSKTLALNVAKIGNYMVDNSSAIKVDAESGKITLQWEEI